MGFFYVSNASQVPALTSPSFTLVATLLSSSMNWESVIGRVSQATGSCKRSHRLREKPGSRRWAVWSWLLTRASFHVTA